MEAEGKERTFSTGAVRDSAATKPMLQLISPHMMLRLGEWLRFACRDRKPSPYPPRNWEKGMPYSETIGSLQRHVEKWKLGMDEEDHLAAIVFNAMALIHYEEEIKAGRLDETLDDMPHYVKSSGNEAAPASKRMPEFADYSHVPQSVRLKIEQSIYPVVYIAGSMRGKRFFNFPAFDEARDWLIDLGFVPISPADIDRELDNMYPLRMPMCKIEEYDRDNWQGSNNDPVKLNSIICRDISVIMCLHARRHDFVYALPDADRSTGASAEMALARWRQLPVIKTRADVMKYAALHCGGRRGKEIHNG